jgi:penicillin-binding protein 1B
VDLARAKLKAQAGYIRFRIWWSRFRLKRAIVITGSVATVAVTIEAIFRGHIAPPAARAPSALFTRQTPWAPDDEAVPVAFASLDPALNERREPVRLNEMPQHLLNAVLAIEDKRFFDHFGFDPRRIAGAMVANFRAGGISEGGSTITQQLAKNLFLTADRTPVRKFREAALTVALELRHSKREILEAYLNEIYLGRDGSAAIHGVGAAARYYFGKPASRLTISESATLAGMIRSPNRLAPTRHPREARDRRNLVIALMAQQKRIADEPAERARDARLPNRTWPSRSIDARYFRDFVASSMNTRMPARGGAVYTTLDARLQRSAERAIVRGTARLGRPGLQAALVAIDPRTGDVLAMVGGSSYTATQFNRATDAHRQPGSAFKPFVALAALEAGPNGQPPAFTLASRIEDEPLRVSSPQGDWLPANYDGRFRGEVTLREAMEQSLNVPMARVGLQIGPQRIADAAKRFGVTSKLNPVPSLALGSSEVTLLELVRAYGALATEGELATTRSVTGRKYPGGTKEELSQPALTRVADPAATFLVTQALRGVVQRGTARALDAGRFYGDIAGKTGTSNDWRDAWFVAYAPNIVVGVWVGFDDGRPVGLAGGAAAVPIVSDFFTIAEAPLDERFAIPDGIEEGSVAGRSWWGGCGEREYFLAGTVPPESQCGFRGIAENFFGERRDDRRDDGRYDRNDRNDDRRRDRRGDRNGDEWRMTGEELRRLIMDRIRAELEASRAESNRSRR